MAVSHRPWRERESESFPLDCTASWKWQDCFLLTSTKGRNRSWAKQNSLSSHSAARPSRAGKPTSGWEGGFHQPSLLVLKAEPTPEQPRQRCHPLSSRGTVQTTAGPRVGLPLLGQQAGHSWPPLCTSGVALLLQLEECKPPELLLRIGQEKSTNSNRKSKCPLQTCTRYKAIQCKKKNQTLDDGDYIMLWINL